MKYKGVPIANISIYSTPAIYFELLIITIQDNIKSLLNFVKKRAAIIFAIISAFALVTYLPFLQVKNQ